MSGKLVIDTDRFWVREYVREDAEAIRLAKLSASS